MQIKKSNSLRSFSSRIISGALALLIASDGFAQSEFYTVDQYLGQVESDNQQLRGVEDSVKGANLRTNEYKNLTAPNVFAEATISRDRREVPSPIFQGRESKAQIYNLGLSQNTDFGLAGRLYYQTQHVQVSGADPNVLRIPDYYNTAPVIELNQSLWRNWGGAEIKAQQEFIKARTQSDLFKYGYDRASILHNAELSYWKLALARENLDLAKANMDRAKQFKDWASRRAKYQLTDKADFYQSETALASRELDYQQAIDSERITRMSFNIARGLDKAEVEEKLAPFDMNVVQKLEVTSEFKETLNLKASLQQVRMSKATSQLLGEGLKPTFNAFANLSFNGRDAEFNPSYRESLSSKNPYFAFGLRFNMPLDYKIIRDATQGYGLVSAAAEKQYQQLALEQKMLWNDLIARFHESRKRLEKVYFIEKAKLNQLKHERERLNRGRTTTAQVLLFEGDYANSQLARIQNLKDVLDLYAQIKNEVILPGGGALGSTLGGALSGSAAASNVGVSSSSTPPTSGGGVGAAGGQNGQNGRF